MEPCLALAKIANRVSTPSSAAHTQLQQAGMHNRMFNNVSARLSPEAPHAPEKLRSLAHEEAHPLFNPPKCSAVKRHCAQTIWILTAAPSAVICYLSTNCTNTQHTIRAEYPLCKLIAQTDISGRCSSLQCGPCYRIKTLTAFCLCVRHIR